jgi:hypothetical protein
MSNAEREAFEKWAGNNCRSLSRFKDGDYTNTNTQLAWEAWQARAQASGVPDDDEWKLTDNDVSAWRERNDLDGVLSLLDCRTAIEDARSIHAINDAPPKSASVPGSSKAPQRYAPDEYGDLVEVDDGEFVRYSDVFGG